MNPIAVKTAKVEQSIWWKSGEDAFRKNIVRLGDLSKIPGDSKTYSLREWEQRHPNHADIQRVLTIDDEQQLADGLSYIAASKLHSKGRKTVSAVAVEENINSRGLTIRLAANRTIHTKVPEQLKAIFALLSSCAKKGSHSYYTLLVKLLTISPDISEISCNTFLLPIIIKLTQERIHHRLFPPADPPLHQNLSALLPKFRDNPHASRHVQSLKRLIANYKDVRKKQTDQAQVFQKAVESSLDFWTAIATLDGYPTSISTVDENSTRVAKTIEQVGKVGRYKDVCILLIKAARRYPGLFGNLKLEMLPPYMSRSSHISFMRKRVDCLVHAEIQLLTFYGLTQLSDSRQPRVLGVSKSACFLCDLFISLHGHFFFSKTHGRLYDTWTVPDLVEYLPDQRQEYRRIIRAIDRACTGLVARRSKLIRPYPAESSRSLNEYRTYSPMAATTVTCASSQVTLSQLEHTENGEVDSNAFGLENHDEMDRASTSGMPEPELLSLGTRNSSQVRLHHSGLSLKDEPAQGIPDIATASSPSPEVIQARSCHDEAERKSYPAQVDSELQASSFRSPTRPSIDIGPHGISVEDFSHTVSHPVSSLEGTDSSVLPAVQKPARKNSSRQMLTQSGAFSTLLEGLHIHFEAEEPTQGSMKITPLPGDLQPLARAIKVDTLTPGEVVDLYRDDAASSLYLSLCRNGHRPIGIELVWLRD
ncbi:MAG: hypothetical protein LQ352_006639 [Teloschistes flavicans]|nr:MAG: hypothetical protein LQ352_006639 [Teloschistes flavicans]